MTGILIDTGEDTKKHEGDQIKMEAETGEMLLQVKTPRMARSYQKLGRGKEGLFTRAFRESMALLTL